MKDKPYQPEKDTHKILNVFEHKYVTLHEDIAKACKISGHPLSDHQYIILKGNLSSFQADRNDVITELTVSNTAMEEVISKMFIKLTAIRDMVQRSD